MEVGACGEHHQDSSGVVEVELEVIWALLTQVLGQMELFLLLQNMSATIREVAERLTRLEQEREQEIEQHH